MTSEVEDDAASSSTEAEAAANDAPDTKDVMRERLSSGFLALRKHRDQGPSDTTVFRLKELTPDYLSYALVHFVDPPSSSSGSVSASNSRHGSDKPGMLPNQKPVQEFYPKLSAIFANEYKSVLRNVPYRHFRSGQGGTIESLHIQPFVTKSALLLGTDPVPWEGAGQGDWLAGDAAEWHTTPYCHVYLAACESLEQYRTKVKPSIQAFVSQIESSSSAGSTSGTGSGPATSSASSSAKETSSSAQYVIVFIPTGDHHHTPNDDAGKTSRIGVSWTSRVAAAGRRMAREASTENASSAGVSVSAAADAAANNSGELVEDSDAVTSSTSSTTTTPASHQSLTAHLSKIDKEIIRRFVADFSATGKVCTLSTLARDSKACGGPEQYQEIQKLEWKEFLRCLGTSIGDGFKERCHRYDEEIRQQDALRAVATAAASDINNTKARVQLQRTGQKFDLVYFFLVKESLAFTYEQMCLPSEALLQYDELRAVLPDVNSDDKDIASSMVGEASIINTDSELFQLAIRGDGVGFRRRIRSMEGDLKPIAPTLLQYLLSRETCLLFKMNNALVAAERCLSFVKSMYEFKKECYRKDGGGDSENKQRLIEVEKWAFEFCWDVKIACDIYLADDVTESQCNTDFEKEVRTQKNDEALARCICDVLEFARLRLLNLGGLVLGENPLGSRLRVVDQVLHKEWKPWRPGTSIEDESFHEEDYEPATDDDFINDAVKSTDSFMTRYLELLKVMVAFNSFSGRKRCAARLGMDVASIYVVKGNPERATLMLREAAKVFAKDQWQSCHFMLLFRLAAYQREVSTADDYVETLVQCFSPAHSTTKQSSLSTAPSKALGFLLADLESVLRSQLVSHTRLIAKPIFAPILGLEGKQRAGSVRDLLKKVYSIGECASITLSITSFLPKDIEVDEVAIELVPFRAYIQAMEDSTVCKDEDVFHQLRKEGPIKISSGLNEFDFDWVPMASGQFILSSTTIKWKGVRFFYITKDQKHRPTIRIDVVPAEPTQSIKLTPDYLVPGDHEQPVQLTFHAGSDIVKEGTIKLSCSDGLLLSSPCPGNVTEKEWSSSCTSTLPSCNPDGTHEMTILVKPNDENKQQQTKPGQDGPQELRAVVSTLYQCPYPKGKDGKPDESSEMVGEEATMDHTMESHVVTLEKQLLTIENMDMVPYTSDRVVLNVSLQCNSPASLLVKSWKINLPSFIALASNGDMNACLAEARIKPSERISMSFDCNYTENDTDTSSDESHLTVDVQNEFDQIFSERLELSLKRPTARRVTLPKNLNAIEVQVSPSTFQGLAGMPITLQYTINAHELFSALSSLSGCVHYQLSFDSADWIISGRTEGLVSKDQHQFVLEFLAIPARPGVLERYPPLSLDYVEGGGSSTTAADADSAAVAVSTLLDMVDQVTPAPFRSEAPPMYTTVAAPIQTPTTSKPNRAGSLKS